MRKTRIAIIALLFLLAGWVAESQDARDPVILVDIRGVINPLSARYLDRALQLARQELAQAVIVRLDTPGGLESSMREMAQALLESPVPTVVYVAPQGARATSAGMFITVAASVAAMAPATHIGAAHPVPLGAQADEIMDEKIVSDAAAFARSLAEARGRNAAWVERAVRENLSVTAEEALETGVIELIAADLDDLLAQLDGREVTTPRGSVVLQTRTAPLVRRPMNALERFWHIITDPNIAYLLLSLGVLLFLVELAEPGLSVSGIASVLASVIAFLGLGNLPVNWAGVALLGLSAILFVVGLLTDADVLVTAAALVPFILGSLLLFSPFTPTSPALPALRVSPWLIGGMSAGMLAVALVVLRAVVAATRLPPRSGAERLIGQQGRALTDLTPNGQVRVDLQDWSAVAVAGRVQAGDPVQVVGVRGVRLQVVPIKSETLRSTDEGGMSWSS